MSGPTPRAWHVVFHACLGVALASAAHAEDVVDAAPDVVDADTSAAQGAAPDATPGTGTVLPSDPTPPVGTTPDPHGAVNPHGAMENHAAMPSQAGMRLMVLKRESSGALTPMGRVPVRRERWRRKAGMDEGADLVAAWTLVSGPAGELVVPAEPLPGPGESDRIVAIWNGVEWELDPQDPDRPSPLRTLTMFDVTAETSAFVLDADLEVTFVDDHFIIRQNISLVNQGLEAIDFTRGEGLRVPLLVHELFGEPNDIGFLPLRPDTRHTAFSVSQANSRLAVERGALVFRGVVPPGPPVGLRAVITVPYVGDSAHRLALRAPYPMRVVFNVLVPPRSGIRVALAGSHRGAEVQRAEGVLRVLAPVKPLVAGEPVTLIVEHTPDRRPVMRAIGFALGGGALFIISAIFFATRRLSGRRQG